MRFMKLKLFIIAFFIFTASSALADSFYYDVSIDTSSLIGSDGYLYFQYVPVFGAADSTAIVSNYSGGLLASSRSSEVDGSAVTGLLPGTVFFANTNGVNDYNQGITFGDAIDFRISFSGPAPDGTIGGSSTFSLGLFQDEFGSTPLLTSDGTLFTADLINDGTSFANVFAGQAAVTYVPEAGTLWLLGPGLLGLLGIRGRIKK